MSAPSTSYHYFLAQNKALEYQLGIAEIKLGRADRLNATLANQLAQKNLEILDLNGKLCKLQGRVRQATHLKLRVEQLEKDVQLRISDALKKQSTGNSPSDLKFNSTSDFDRSDSEPLGASKTSFDIVKLQRNSLGDGLDLLEAVFHRKFPYLSSDLKDILFKYIKVTSRGVGILDLVHHSGVLFQELNQFVQSMTKSQAVNNLLVDFLAESNQIFTDDEDQDSQS